VGCDGGMENRSLSSVITVSTIIGIALVGVAVYYAYQWAPPSPVEPQEQTQVQPPIQQDETANWQTYRNEEYGFEVRYPGAWVLAFDNTDMTGLEEPETNIIFGISYFENKEKLTLNQWLKADVSSEPATVQTFIEFNDVGGVRAVQHELTGSVYLIHDDMVFMFSNGISFERRVIDEDIVKTILSTFKFIEQVRQSNSAIPPIVNKLCSTEGVSQFITEDEFHADFRSPAASAQRCDDGALWKVREPAVSESGDFYFDADGNFIDLCQGLFRSSGCKRFENVSCEQTDYCKQ